MLLYRMAAVLVCLSLMFALSYTVLGLPTYKDPDAPTNNEVSQRYVEQGTAETGAVNTVAGMILDYRAFDTFGESTVLFAATAAVLFISLSKHTKEWTERGPFANPSNDLIFQVVGKLLLPMILVYGIYVVLNGHLSPGGGFSGGAVLGGGLILASSMFGQKRLTKVLSPTVTTNMSVGCLMCYAAMKSYSFFTGANHIGWEIPKGTPGDIISAGFILPLNICVGIIVACTMFSFYSLFSQVEEE
jgi:multicomponent Na+:H+ antiporter subunit B